jgi:amidase
LEDLIEFNKQHADLELPSSKFPRPSHLTITDSIPASGAPNQTGLLAALTSPLTGSEYHTLIALARSSSGANGFDKCLDQNAIDIIIGPGDGNLFHIPGNAGYPSATLPLGYLDFNGRPFGLQMAARAHREDLLVRAMSAWESTFPGRRPPDLEAMRG